MLQLACAISTRNVSAYGLVTTRLYCSGNWRIASARGRGAAAGGIKPKSGQYVGSASRVSCFFAPLEAAPGPRPLLFDLRPGIHAIHITYVVSQCGRPQGSPPLPVIYQYILVGLRRRSLGSSTSSASSTVTTPSRMPSSLTTGTASRLYFAMISATVRGSVSGRTVIVSVSITSFRVSVGSEISRSQRETTPSKGQSSDVSSATQYT